MRWIHLLRLHKNLRDHRATTRASLSSSCEINRYCSVLDGFSEFMGGSCLKGIGFIRGMELNYSAVRDSLVPLPCSFLKILLHVAPPRIENYVEYQEIFIHFRLPLQNHFAGRCKRPRWRTPLYSFRNTF